jgi:hypothetical protein
MSFQGRYTKPPKGRKVDTEADRKRKKAAYQNRKPQRKQRARVALELHRSAMLSRLCPAPSTLRAISEAVEEFDRWDAAPKGLSRGRRKSA